MRPILAALMLVPTVVIAQPLPRALSAEDVTITLRPVTDDIQHCYLDRTSAIRGAGKLQLELHVARSGDLDAVVVKTPGLSSRLAKQIEGCVRDAVASVEFPARKTHTTATVPYFFQHTAARGAGPLLGCYAQTGCR